MLTSSAFESLIEEMRPELHRYAARMTGSVIDGEDIVQEAVIKAYASFSLLKSDSNLRGWLFTITHNKTIDYLRRTSQEPLELLDENILTVEPDLPLEDKELSIVALSVFLKLVPRQRSCVILKDVLGYSLAEISELLNATIPEIKATLHRGRTRLRELAANAEALSPNLDEQEKELLSRYIERFNARDFDAVRDMLAEEVQLDLMGRRRFNGIAEVNNKYFQNYKQLQDWYLRLGIVEGQLAILIYDPQNLPTQVAYFILIAWDKAKVSHIRDYRYARYVIRDAMLMEV